LLLSLDRMMNNHCPECRAPLHHYRRGASLLVRCSSPNCIWGAVTSYPVPVLQDRAQYTIRVPALPEATASVLLAINLKFPHGIPVTRRLAIRGELPPFVGCALDVWHEAQRLRDAGVPFHIEPNFPYDLDSPTTAFGPADGRIPDDPGTPGLG
jgi:LSD1 subclass zinc finger protein